MSYSQTGGLLGVPLTSQTGLLSGLEDIEPWKLALLQASQGFAQASQPGASVASVLAGGASGAARGLLLGQAGDKRRGLLDQAMEGVPENERAAYRLMTPAQLGEAIQKRQQRRADYDALQAIPGLSGLLGGASPAGQDAFAQQPVATPASMPATSSLPARLPVGRTASATTVPDNLRPIYEQAAAQYGIPVDLLIAQGRQESGFNPNAVGGAGEVGLAQIHPKTAANPGYGVPPISLEDARDPAKAIPWQAQYLAARGRAQGADFSTSEGQNRALAAYNGGGDPNYVQNVRQWMPGQGAPAADATPAAATQGAPINPNTILRVAQAAAQGNEAARSLLPVLQSMSKQDMKTTTIAPGGTVVRQNPDGTVTEIYRSPDREDNQLLSVMGPDGKPVLMRRAQAEGQVPFSAPQVAIDQRGQSTYDQERGKTAAAAVGTIESQAAAAPGTLRQLDQLERASQGFQTGAGAGARMTVGKIAQALGIKDDALPAGLNKDAIASGEQIQSVTGQLVMSQIGSGGFPANNFSDADRAFLERIQPGIERTPQGNRILIGVLRANAQRNAEIGQAWRDWRKQHGDNLASVQEFQATKLPEITGRDILAPMFQDAIPTEQQTAPGQVQADPPPRAQPAAQVPSRPPALPAGSQYSPSRGQWRDPSGRIYDREGRPVQ